MWTNSDRYYQKTFEKGGSGMSFEQQLTQLLHVLDAAKESGHCVYAYTLSPNGCGERSTIMMEISNDNIDNFRWILLSELYNLNGGCYAT